MRICLFLIFLSVSAFAKFPLIRMEGLTGSFVDSRGRAYAKSALYDLDQVLISHKNIEVEISKPKKSLVIRDPSTTVNIKFDFSFIDIFTSFDFGDLDISSEKYDFTVSSKSALFNIQDQRYELTNILMKTENDENDVSTDMTVIEGITKNSSISIDRIAIFDSIAKDLIDQIAKDNNSSRKDVRKVVTLSNEKSIFRRTYVKNLNLEVKEKVLRGYAWVDSIVNFRFYFGGDVKAIKTPNKEEFLIVRLGYIRAGVFSIKRIVLKQLRKLKLNNVEIRGDKIFIKIKDNQKSF